MEGIIKAVCISEKRGTVKKNINEVNVIKDFGLEGDAHAGKWHRQVSFLSADIVDEFNEKGASVIEGDFGENILAYGIDFKKLPVGTKLICNDAKFEIKNAIVIVRYINVLGTVSCQEKVSLQKY